MRLSYLREFVALTDYAKLTAAARALHVSPSTLSQHVAALEREIGCELFSRDGGFTLTEDGFRALGHARSILCEYDELLRDCAESEEDVVYLSFPIWDMCQPPLARAKDAFRELHPDVKVVLSSNEHDLDDPVEMLVNGSSDVSLLYLIRESGQRIADMVPSDISWVPVGAYRVVFACAPQHPNADKGVLTAGDLDQATVITGLHPLASIFAEGIVAVLGGHGSRFAWCSSGCFANTKPFTTTWAMSTLCGSSPLATRRATSICREARSSDSSTMSRPRPICFIARHRSAPFSEST